MPLHPQSRSFLDAIAEQEGPGWHEMPPQDGREQFKALMDLFGTGPELHSVEEAQTESGINIRLYSPEPVGDAPLPAVMYFHGGGWVLGDIDTHDSLCRSLADKTGFIVASVDYGRAPENKFPGPLNDCYDATKHVLEHANVLGVDPEKIAVAGDSAGGNLAASVSLKSRDDENGPSIKAQVLIYPVIKPDFETATYSEFAEGFGLSREEMQWFWNQYLEGESQTNDPLASPSNASSFSDLPTTHLVTAEYDVLRDEGEQFAKQLSDAGVPVSTKRYDGMLHGFVHLQSVFDDSAVAIDDIANILKLQLA